MSQGPHAPRSLEVQPGPKGRKAEGARTGPFGRRVEGAPLAASFVTLRPREPFWRADFCGSSAVLLKLRFLRHTSNQRHLFARAPAISPLFGVCRSRSTH